MKNNTTQELKHAIMELEEIQLLQKQRMIEQLHETLESFKPLNVVKSTLHDMTSTSFVIDNLLGGLLGITSGFLSKKMVVGASANVFRKVIGSVMQMGVANVVSQNIGSLKSVGQYIFHQIFQRKQK